MVDVCVRQHYIRNLFIADKMLYTGNIERRVYKHNTFFVG